MTDRREEQIIPTGEDRAPTILKTEHPCPYSDEVLARIDFWLPPPPNTSVLDPFAGTGRIHELSWTERAMRSIWGIELEPEWAAMHPDTRVGDARSLPYLDGYFDAVATSPCFGNRMADHHDARDASRRITYRHSLGRPLSEGSAGGMQWGPEYRQFHRDAWAEAVRVLSPDGRFVLHSKDHIRGGARQHVTDWHVWTLEELGLVVVGWERLACRSMRYGANSGVRVEHEDLVVLDRR